MYSESQYSPPWIDWFQHNIPSCWVYLQSRIDLGLYGDVAGESEFTAFDLFIYMFRYEYMCKQVRIEVHVNKHEYIYVF
jgi:hypothetical protein